jgi:hypothetical protein
MAIFKSDKYEKATDLGYPGYPVFSHTYMYRNMYIGLYRYKASHWATHIVSSFPSRVLHSSKMPLEISTFRGRLL